jgi:hypothetical protein
MVHKSLPYLCHQPSRHFVHGLNSEPNICSLKYDQTLTVVGTLGKLAVPPVAYRLNCFGPPHIAVPVDAGPVEALQTQTQTSVHACALVRLLIADDP